MITSVFETNEWLETDQQVLEMAASPDGKFSVALAAPRGRDDRRAGGLVMLLAQDLSSVEDAIEYLFATGGPTAFDWSPDGRFVVGFETASLNFDGDLRSEASVTVYDLNRGIFNGRRVRQQLAPEADAAALDLRFLVDSIAFQEVLDN